MNAMKESTTTLGLGGGLGVRSEGRLGRRGLGLGHGRRPGEGSCLNV